MNTVNQALSDLWVTCATPKPQAKLRLFIFPYAGAGTAAFRAWNTGLPSEVEVCAIRLPGRETRIRETPISQMTPLAETLTDAIQGHLDKPYVFYGHSMGALVAFEVARNLRRRGQALPQHLVISARRAPQLPEVDAPIHGLPDNAFVAKMQERYGGIPDVILQSPELMALFVPVLKADFKVIETYTYQPEAPLGLPISAFAGTQDRVRQAGDVEGWQAQTTGAFTFQDFVGNHFFIQSQQAAFLASVSGILKRYV